MPHAACLQCLPPPGAGPDAAMAVAKSCLVEAMLTPQVPCIIAADFTPILEGQPLETAFDRHGWVSAMAGVPLVWEEHRIDWMLLDRPAKAVAQDVRSDWRSVLRRMQRAKHAS